MRERRVNLDGKLASDNVIETAQTKRAAPIIFPPMKDGLQTLSIDFCKHSSVTMLEGYLIRSMASFIELPSEAAVLTMIDEKSWYCHVKIENEDQDRTAFITHCGPYGSVLIPSIYEMLRSRSRERHM